MEKLVCDRCGVEYTDEGSLKTAKDYQEVWKEMCGNDLTEPRGLCPCPNISCPGELILKEE